MLRAFDFVIVARRQPALELTADTAQSRRSQHAFRRAADAEQQIDAGFLLRRGNGGCNIAVADQTNARAGLAHFLNERLMARPRKYDHREILDLTSLGFSERVEVFRWAFGQIDHPFTVGTRGNLSHVSIRAVE